MKSKMSMLVLMALLLSGVVPTVAGGSELPLLADNAITVTASNIEFVGQTGGASYAVAVQGDYAYVGVGPRLIVLKISSPTTPTPIGITSPLSGVIQDIALDGNYAYVTAEAGGLYIFNISNPNMPVLRGHYDTPLFALGVAVQEQYVYVANLNGLRIVNVSDPTAPYEVGFLCIAGDVYDVQVNGHYAFVTNLSAGIRVIDVNLPNAPVEVASLDTPGQARNLAISDTLVYVADYNGGLRIVDISNPTNPTEIGAFPGNYPTYVNVAVSGDYAYIADFNDGLHVLSVASPTSPVQVGYLDRRDFTNAVAVLGDYAFVAHHSGLQVVSVRNKSHPSQVGVYDSVGFVRGIEASMGWAYLASGNPGIHMVSTVNPQQPTMFARADTDCAEDVIVEGEYAYVADCFRGLKIIGNIHTQSPSVVGSVILPGWAYGLTISGTHAYIAGDDKGLRVVDVSNPAQPSEVGFCDTPGNARGVAVIGDYAYVADGGSGLRVIDVSNPTNPSEVGFCDTPGFAYDVAVVGSYAYVADGGSGLRIINISNPANPSEVGFYDTQGYSFGMAVSNDYAYIADSSSLLIVDVSNPSSPSEIGYYDTPGLALDVALVSNYVYVAGSNGGLLILWATSPVSTAIPTSGGSLISPGDNTTYIFSAGTFTDTVILTHTIRFPGSVPPTGTLIGINHVFEVAGVYSSTGQSAQPTQPYTITVQYTDAEKGLAFEDTLALYRWDGSQWVKESSSVVDTVANTVTATPNHFSLWAVLGETGRVYLPLILRNY